MVHELVFGVAEAPTPSCHAASVATITGGVIAVWFGGEKEGAADVGIFAATRREGAWGRPRRIVDDPSYPCWNPVLAHDADGRLYLYYRVGESPRAWWSEVVTSDDDGDSWGAPAKLRDGFLGPIKNKPVLLDDGRFLSPSSTEHDGWRAVIEVGEDELFEIADPEGLGPIQPTIVRNAAGFLAWCRTRSGVLGVTRSADGLTWSALASTDLPNPNSGVDAASLADGRIALVWNPVGKAEDRWGGARTPLVVSVSSDGESFEEWVRLEEGPGEYSYPSIVADESNLHVVYTHQRKTIAYAEIPASASPRGSRGA